MLFLANTFLLVAEMVQKVTASIDIWTVSIWIQHPTWSSWEDTQETGVPTNHLHGQVSFVGITQATVSICSANVDKRVTQGTLAGLFHEQIVDI